MYKKGDLVKVLPGFIGSPTGPGWVDEMDSMVGCVYPVIEYGEALFKYVTLANIDGDTYNFALNWVERAAATAKQTRARAPNTQQDQEWFNAAQKAILAMGGVDAHHIPSLATVREIRDAQQALMRLINADRANK
jgi:hypothetical protein